MFAMIIPYFNAEDMYVSGLVPTWRRVGDGRFILPLGDKAISMQQREYRNPYSTAKNIMEKQYNYIFSCDEQRFWDELYEYFDISYDYKVSNEAYRHISKDSKIACNRGRGIRVLKQNLWDIILQYVCFYNLSPEETRSEMDRLYQDCGTKHKQGLRDLGGIVWYEAPSPEQILKKKNAFESLRKRNILKLCRIIVDGKFNLEELKSLEYEEAKVYLKNTLKLHDEQIECICLYGLHFIEAFPIDGAMKEFLEENGVETKDEFNDWTLGYEAKDLGIFFSYWRYHSNNKPRRIEQYDLR